MQPGVRTLVLTVVLATLPAPAAAQRVVIATAAPGGPARTDLLDVATGRTRQLSDAAADQAFFVSDGAIVVWHPSGALQWRATVAGTGQELVLPTDFAPIDVVHPRVTAVFGFRTVGAGLSLAMADASGIRTFDACPTSQLAGPVGVLPTGTQVIVACGATPTVPFASYALLDVLTGATIRRVDFPAGVLPLGLAVTGSGSEFVVVYRDLAGFHLERREIATGTLRADALLPVSVTTASRNNMLAANPRRPDRPALVRCEEAGQVPSGYSCRIDALDAPSLATVATLQVAGPFWPTVTYSAYGDFAVVSGVTAASFVDTDGGQALQSALAPPSGFISAAWGAEPQAPALSPPAVGVSAVSLSWVLPPESTAATTYRLEAGTQPGLANLVVADVGPAPSFFASGVPPGRYHVRIRAVNANGVSRPSNEVVVDVP